MTALTAALAALAVAVSAHTAWHTRRALNDIRRHAEFRWRLTARRTTEDEHRLGVNGHTPPPDPFAAGTIGIR